MGSGAASTKISKRNSGEDRGRRKKEKSRKRRRVSFSPASYSSYSDDDHRGRRRRRISRRQTRKLRERESRLLEKKKSRKARRRSVSSSSSYSSSTCSTCRSRSRSRSRSKRVKPKSKARRSSVDKVRRSSGGRLGSRSCSTCSEGGGPKSPKDDTKRVASSSMACSPNDVEQRYGSQGRDPDRSDGYDGGEEQVVELGRWMDEGPESKDLYFGFENGLSTGEEEHPERMIIQYSKKGEELESMNQISRRIKSEIVIADKNKTYSDELDELVLRQKALENLKKFHGKPSNKSKNIGDGENVLPGDESAEQHCRATQSQQRDGAKVTSVAEHSPKRSSDFPSGKRVSNLKFQEVNLLRGPEEVDDSINAHRETDDAGRGTSDRTGVEVSVAEGRMAVNTCSDAQNSVETVVENQSGSQFEQKTFSRMHDGEMVQVSYKVYIPKKPPALARRKLQR
ncbi:hypothetical protein AXF42_Ash019817 [Apostasia shenzhenica]|uniref:Uncharacterized protein n=1 Tax=Apostasia shenzhenica TaxID=1088818 RepID=A0A2I0ARD3_9ASPA|nr:hypothetical protein AXF42_Ash019817 [Apostasia shenzhenica]